MELKRYLRILWNWWWLVLVTFITVVIATIAFTYTRIPEYESIVRLVVSPSAITATDVRELRETIADLDKPIVVNTYAEIGQSPTIISSAWSQLGLPSQKAYKVNSSVLQETNIIVITITGPNAELVQQLAEAVANQTLAHVATLYEVYDLSLLDPASISTTPINPNIKLNLALGVILGLGLSVIVAFLAEYLKTPMEQIEQLSIVDARTGAYKETYLMRRLRSEMSRSKRVQRPFVVGIVRLENFNEMVDGFSPKSKQLVLKQVVQLLKQSLPEENLVAQWRGDTLALLMPDFDLESAQRIMEKVQSRVEWTTFEVDDTGIKLNFVSNFGLALYDLNGIGPEDLLQMAEQSLQESCN